MHCSDRSLTASRDRDATRPARASALPMLGATRQIAAAVCRRGRTDVVVASHTHLAATFSPTACECVVLLARNLASAVSSRSRPAGSGALPWIRSRLSFAQDKSVSRLSLCAARREVSTYVQCVVRGTCMPERLRHKLHTPVVARPFPVNVI
jgi:hypothetical protein